MKRRTLPLALILAAVSIAHALIGVRLQAQTKFGITSGGASGGSGTVTSVAATVPGEITLTGSPITTTGTFAFSWANQATSKIFAAPCGSTGTPTFRVLCAADIPALDPSKITGTAVITSDSRLTDARTPTAHASTHASVGSDPVTLAESQVTGLTAALAGKQATGNYVTSLTGDVVASGPGAAAATIQANSVALGTDTTGGYAGSSTEGGSATTADALAANGTNCSAPNFGRGVDAAGNCEGAAIVASDLPSTAVTPGSYTHTALTVDAQGRITAASSGTAGDTLPVVDTTAVAKGSSDASKLLRFEVDGFTTATTRVMTPPNADATLAGINLAQTWTSLQNFTTSPTSPGSGASSERFGANATTGTGTNNTAIGADVTIAGQGNTALGNLANAGGTTTDNGVAIGKSATSRAAAVAIGASSIATGQGSVAVGQGSNIAGASSIGLGVDAFAAGFADCIAIGRAATCSAANQMVLGNGSGHVITSTIIPGATQFGVAGTAGSTKTIADAFGSFSLRSASTEQLTLSTSGTTTATSGSIAVSSAEIRAIAVRITTTIATATDWSVALTTGIGSCTTAWVAIGTTTSAQTTLTSGTTVVFQPASGLRCHTSTAATITVTTTGTPSAGVIRITPIYEQFSAPTS